MCRLAAYIGPEINLAKFLLEPEHSLVKQAWAPKEMLEGTINADGFGIGWLSENTSCSYKNVLPIWSDTNLDSLGRSLTSHLWLANVRSATPGQGICESNTQPLINDNVMFTHNGCFTPFDVNVKSHVLDILSNDTKTLINGDSDSIYLFALLQHHLMIENKIPNAIVKMMNDVKSICDDKVSALLNLIISDGNVMYACRHAINKTCPSLYYLLKEDSVTIASEPLDSHSDWLAFDEHSLMSFDASGIIESHNL